MVTNEQTTIGFGDEPIFREASDTLANALSVTYEAATPAINRPLTLFIEQGEEGIRISWPAGDGEFTLKWTLDLTEPDWGNVETEMTTNGESFR